MQVSLFGFECEPEKSSLNAMIAGKPSSSTDAVPTSLDGIEFVSNSRRVVTVCLHHESHSVLEGRGVMFNNPLFVQRPPVEVCANHSNARTAQGSGICKLLDKIVCCAPLLVAAMLALAFIVVPILTLESSNYDRPKTVSFCLLFVCGILQSLMIRSTLPYEVSKRLSWHHKFWKLSIILFTSMIAFRNEKEAVMPVRAKTYTPSINHGNCSLMENIPKNMIRFANKEQDDRRQMLYDGSCDHGMPVIVSKYDSILLSAVEVLFDLVTSTTVYGDWLKEKPDCVQPVFQLVVYLALPPCQHDCRRSEFICQEQCNLLNRRCIELQQSPEVDVDALIASYGSALKTFVEPLFERVETTENAQDKPRWAEQVTRYLLTTFVDGFSLNCKSKDAIDEIVGASCFYFDGRIHHSKRQQVLAKSIDAYNCSMDHMYQSLRESNVKMQMAQTNHNTAYAGVSRNLTFLDCAILATYYCYACLPLLMWKSPSNIHKDRHKTPPRSNDGTFLLSLQSIAYLAFLGLIGCLFGFLIFYFSFRLVENKYGVDNEVQFHLSWIYFMLGGSTSISCAIGLRNIFIALFYRKGTTIDAQKQKRRRGKNGITDVVCVRWLTEYRNNTRPRNGKWFFLKMLFWECFEIILQTTSLHQFATSRSQEFVLFASALLLINMIATPIMFYKSAHASFPNVSIYNGVILTFDTTIDTMFFALNLSSLEATDLYENPFIGTTSLVWPVFCVMMRLRSLSRLVLVKYTADRTRSHRSSRSNREKYQGTYYCRFVYVFAILVVVALFTFAQFLIVVSSFIAVNAKCASEIGPILWKGATPKYTFSNGIFGMPTCAYAKIERIHAPKSQLTSVSKYIDKCTNLIELNLAENNIAELPKELLLMDRINVADFTGNPVHSDLAARNLSLTGGIPPFIIRHLNASLETLDLSNNCLGHVDKNIGLFQKLRSLHLDNNCLKSNSLSWEVLKLHSLDEFAVAGNVLESAVNWSNQLQTNDHLDDAIIFLKTFFKHTLKQLNVSHNAFRREHYDDLVEIFPHLVSFDISYNMQLKTSHSNPLNGISNLTHLSFMSIEGNEGIVAIGLDDLEEMNNRMTTQTTVFCLRNIGLTYLDIEKKCERESCLKQSVVCKDVSCLIRNGQSMIYPREIMKQIGPSLLSLNIVDTIWEGFKADDLCDFESLRSVSWKFKESYKGMVEDVLPACLQENPSLSVIDINRAGLLPPTIFKILNLKVVYFVPNIHVHAIPFPYIVAPPNHTFDRVVLHKFKAPVPPEYGSFRALEIAIDSSSENESRRFEIPRNWKSFQVLGVQGHTSYGFVAGSISHLTIERAAFFEHANVSGPLFQVGPAFKCMRLFGQTESREEFQKKWNLTCTTLEIDTCPDNEKQKLDWKRLQDRADPCWITQSMNCSLTTSTSTIVSVFCFAIPFKQLSTLSTASFFPEYRNRTGVRWECFEELFFYKRTDCSAYFVGRSELDLATKAVAVDVSACT